MMKVVKVYDYKVGLLFRKGNFLKVLQAGTHWLWVTDQVMIYDITKDFIAPCDLDILLQDANFASLVQLIEIKDNEIGIQFRNGNFHKVLGPGRYAYWKSMVKNEFQIFDTDEIEVPKNLDRKLVTSSPVKIYINQYQIQSYERGLLFVEGKFVRELNPGIYYFWKNNKLTSVQIADMRKQQVEISGQELLTKDKAAVRVNFFVQYQIQDLEKALVEVKDYSKQLYLVLQLALREYVGTLSLDELLARREVIQKFILDVAAAQTKELGVQLISCGIRDIILPGEVKEIMNQVLVAQKKAQANIVTRREETASTRSLLNTAKLMEENEMLFKLKEMEFIEKIAENIETMSLNGGGQVIDQLKGLFSNQKS